MTWIIKRWTLMGLLAVLTPGWAQATDCAAYRARFQCEANVKYPLHLSFDDGPALQTTDVLDVLKREKIPATFFVLAEKIDCARTERECKAAQPGAAVETCEALQQCQLRKQILARTKQDGHVIGSHSYSHLRHSEIPPQQMLTDFRKSRSLLDPYLNTNPPLFRLPYGDGWFNRVEKPQVLQALQEVGFQHVAWQLSAFDWNEANQQGDKILANVMEQMCSRKQGGVVLFHDGVDNQMHEGRLFTTTHLQEWIPALRCVADFKPLSFFEKGFVPRP